MPATTLVNMLTVTDWVDKRRGTNDCSKDADSAGRHDEVSRGWVLQVRQTDILQFVGNAKDMSLNVPFPLRLCILAARVVRAPIIPQAGTPLIHVAGVGR